MPQTTPLIVALLLGACLLLGVSGAPSPATSDPAPTGFLFKSLSDAGTSYKYVVYVPRDYDPRTPLPAIMFLHGQGESGSDGQKMIAQGIGTNILWNAARWNCIVIMPQKPDPEKQWEDYDRQVMAMLEVTRHEYSIDPTRIALTGLSQGGHGTWTIGAAHPDVWCSLAPICSYAGDADPKEIAAKVKDIPVWCFHGDADDVVPPSKATVILDALKAAGATPRFSLYPKVNHGSWDRAYAEPELPAWLLKARTK